MSCVRLRSPAGPPSQYAAFEEHFFSLSQVATQPRLEVTPVCALHRAGQGSASVNCVSETTETTLNTRRQPSAPGIPMYSVGRFTRAPDMVGATPRTAPGTFQNTVVKFVPDPVTVVLPGVTDSVPAVFGSELLKPRAARGSCPSVS